jgi:hypothetical protein
MHRYSLTTIISWLIHGLTQWVRDIAPIVSPSPEPSTPPSWWYEFYTFTDWYYNRDQNGIPNSNLIDMWVRGCLRLIGLWVEEVGRWAISQAATTVRIFTGLPSFGYITFQAWLTAIRQRVGTSVPYFALDLADAAYKLYLMIPSRVRHGSQTWDDLFNDLVGRAVDSAIDSLRDVALKAAQAILWIDSVGRLLRDWRSNVRGTVDLLVSDPAGFITSRLGPTWPLVVSFAQDCIVWYYNLKGLWGNELTTFLSDPGGYILDALGKVLDEVW